MNHDRPEQARLDELERELLSTQQDLHRTAEELQRSNELLVARARLDESERRFRATFENAAVGITLVDLEDRFVDANERYREITGYSEDELREKTWRDITHPDDLGTDAALAKALLAGEIDSYDLEKRYVRKDGSIAWVHLSCSVVRNERGEPDYWVAVVQDISERKRLQEALARSLAEQHAGDELRRLALQAAKMGSWELDLATGIVTGDERAQELFGVEQATLPLEVPLSHIHDEDRPRVDALLQDAMNATSSERLYEVEFRTFPAPGLVRWVRGVGRVVFDPGHDPPRPVRFLGILMDDTARKQAEEGLAEANRRKDDYLAILSHELRNPLAAIRTAAAVVARAAQGDTPLTKASAVLERQSSHMARLLDGLLDVSRITRGKLTMSKAPTELGKILRDVLTDHTVQARSGGMQLCAEIDEDPIEVLGDAARLTQIFTNLLGNAVSFTPPGGKVTMRAHARGTQAEVEVIDTGIGFPPELARDLFEPFRQGPQDISRPRGGLGLGLALASGLVELHGGTIEAHSEGIGRGARFTVRLPLTSSPARTSAPARTDDGAPRRVLVIEDNEDSAEMLGQALKLMGHRVELAARGQEGVRLAKERSPDVVLCDIGLPDIDGFQVARALRDDPATQGIRLIALTGYGRPEDRLRCLEAGFDDHLTKPVDLQTIERAIASREA